MYVLWLFFSPFNVLDTWPLLTYYLDSLWVGDKIISSLAIWPPKSCFLLFKSEWNVVSKYLKWDSSLFSVVLILVARQDGKDIRLNGGFGGMCFAQELILDVKINKCSTGCNLILNGTPNPMWTWDLWKVSLHLNG